MNTTGGGSITSLVLSSLLTITPFQTADAASPHTKAHKTAPCINRVKVSQSYETVPDFLDSLEAKHLEAWSQDEMPLKVYFTPPGAELDCFSNNMFVIFRDSCNEWSRVSNNRISFAFTDNPKEANIKVRFSSDRRNVTDPNEAGHATVSSGEFGIVHADIELYTKDRHGKGYGAGGVFKAICLHELGHALGIVGGHSPCPTDVMAAAVPFYEGTPMSSVKLTQRDINTLELLYCVKDSLHNKRRQLALALVQTNLSQTVPRQASLPSEDLASVPQESREAMINDLAEQAVNLYASSKQYEACQLLEKAIDLAQETTPFSSSLSRLKAQLSVYQKHCH